MNITLHTDDLVLGARRMAHSVARRVAPALDPDELRAVADHALVEALQHFDPSRGCTFTTYAHPWVRGAALRAADRGPWHAVAAIDVDKVAIDRMNRPRAEVAIEARRALRRVPYRDRALVFNHIVLGRSLAALAGTGQVPRLRRRYRRAVALARGPRWRHL